MPTAIITIKDREDGLVESSITYEFAPDEDREGPISGAVMQSYLVHYAIKTGKLDDYADEAFAELKDLIDNFENGNK